MPGSLGNEEIDAETFAYYGADYVKNDDCRVIYARAFEVGVSETHAPRVPSLPLTHKHTHSRFFPLPCLVLALP